MALVSTGCIVLHAFAYGDTSRILRLLTRDLGVQSVIARGALRPRSRFGGILEPFTEGIATFYHQPNRDLHTLAAFELAWSPRRLGEDLIRFGGAALLSEVVMRTASEEADPLLFESVSAALHRIADSPADEAEPIVLAECWALIDRLGFAPALELCVACGRDVAPGEETTFDYTAGGVRCGACAAGQPGRRLPAAARTALAALAAGQAVPIPRTAPHWRLLARYLAHHVVGDPPLRSLAFLAGLVRGEGGEGGEGRRSGRSGAANESPAPGERERASQRGAAAAARDVAAGAAGWDDRIRAGDDCSSAGGESTYML